MMMRFLVLFLPLLGLLLASTPIHLKPGALTSHLGRVALVEDVLMVRYPFTSLLSVPADLDVVSANLGAAVGLLRTSLKEESQSPSYLHSQMILKLLTARVEFLHGKLNQTKHDYSLHPVHARTKRGLINALGRISQFLFGTAMDEDVQDLREHYNRLITIAATNRKVLNLNCKKLARLESNLKELLQHSNQLTRVLNSALIRLEALNEFLLLDQTLHVLEASLNSVLATNEAIIRNMVDAASGRVTTSLLPVEDLIHTLKIGQSDFKLQPMYSRNMVQYYYPLLEATLTTDAIIVHIPFRSLDVFEAYQVEPFPFKVNHSVMTLDLPSSLVLVAKDFSLYSIGQMSDLNHCKTSFLHLYYCPASLFAFLPVAGEICEVALTRPIASDALTLCPYKHLVPKPMFHLTFHGFHYFCFVDPIYVAIICPEGTTYEKVLGHYAVLDTCHIRSSTLTTFPSRHRLAFTANFTTRIFPISVLRNLSFSDISFVTNTLSVLTFSNHSEFAEALEESLPVYLNPSILYPFSGTLLDLGAYFNTSMLLCHEGLNSL